MVDALAEHDKELAKLPAPRNAIRPDRDRDEFVITINASNTGDVGRLF